jgi:hypothetical protein
VLNDALRIRWRWLEKEGALREWSGLPFTLSERAEAMARAAIDCSIGDGKRTYFWYDRWIRGQSAADLASDLLAFVSPKKALLMTVAQARQNNAWISALKGTIFFFF